MRSAIFLSIRYIRAHKKQSFMMALITAILIATFVTTVLVGNGYKAGTIDAFAKEYGDHSGIIYNADMQKVQENYDLIQKSNSGIISATMKVNVNSNKEYYMGYMDDIAIKLRRITVIKGRMPEKDNEIAIERSTYSALGLTIKPGETVTISVVDNKKNEQKEYMVVGILENYSTMWSRWSPTQCQSMPVPTILTVKGIGTVQYMHIMCGDNSIKNSFGGEYSASGMDSHKSFMLGSNLNVIDRFIKIFSIIFLVVIVFGVTCILLNTIKERREYLGLLRCIGLKRYKGVLLFLVQGFMLFVVSTVMGSLIGLALSYAFFLLMNMFGLGIIYTLSIDPFMHTFVVVGITITAVFIIPSIFFFAKAPLETSKRKHKKSHKKGKRDIQLLKMWCDSIKREYIVQNIMTVILVAIGMLVSVLETFYVSAEANKNKIVLNNIDYDYAINIGGGGFGAFGINFPRGIGISKADYDKICTNNDIIILDADATLTSKQFFVYDEVSTDAYLKHLIANEKNVLKRDEELHYDKLIAAVGCGENAYVVKPNIGCIDYGTMLKNINIKDSDISKADYISGKYIVAPSSFSVGDKFTVVMPVVKSNENVASKDMEFDFIVNEVIVAATYQGNYNNRIYLSAEYVTEADPTTCFDRVILKNAKTDVETMEFNEDFIMSVVANSKNVEVYNYGAEQREYIKSLNSNLIFMFIVVLVIMASLIITIALSTKLKIRTNMHSYVVMMAIGANKKTVSELIKEDLSRQIMTGCIIGALLAFAFCMLNSNLYQFSLIGIYVLMIAIVAAVFAILYYLTVLSIKKNINAVLKSDIVSTINSVDI